MPRCSVRRWVVAACVVSACLVAYTNRVQHGHTNHGPQWSQRGHVDVHTKQPVARTDRPQAHGAVQRSPSLTHMQHHPTTTTTHRSTLPHARALEAVRDGSGHYMVVTDWVTAVPVRAAQGGPQNLHDDSRWDITLVTHASADHLHTVARTATLWNGSMSAALFLPTRADARRVLAILPHLAHCRRVTSRLTLHLVVPVTVWEHNDVVRNLTLVPSTWGGLQRRTGNDEVHGHGAQRGGPASMWPSSHSCVDINDTMLRQGTATHHVDADHSANYASVVPYPNNMLRNVARAQARTVWSLVVDADMVVGPPNLPDLWREAGRSGVLQLGKRVAYVLPAFEVDTHTHTHADGTLPSPSPSSLSSSGAASFPRTRNEVVAAFNRTVRTFYVEPCAKCHRPTDYSTWLAPSAAVGARDAWAYPVSYVDPWEPFYISETALTPPYDERFVQYGFNRISQLCTMWMAGFDFSVVRAAFVMHSGWKRPEKFHPRKQAEQDANRLKYRALKEELKARYPGPRRCNVHGRHV
eukprot:m.216166 g.216166  ORF g.216166 m.216166 type:complete len:524 (-) comp28193_c0_seq1:181-1752(-)